MTDKQKQALIHRYAKDIADLRDIMHKLEASGAEKLDIYDMLYHISHLDVMRDKFFPIE